MYYYTFLSGKARQKTQCAKLEVLGHAHSYSFSAGWDRTCEAATSFGWTWMFLSEGKSLETHPREQQRLH